MNKLTFYVTVGFLTISFSKMSHAQDIGISSIILPVAGSDLSNDVKITFKVVVKNYGSTVVAAQTSVTYYAILGTMDTVSFAGKIKFDLSPGDSSRQSFEGTLTNQELGPINFCMWVNLSTDINHGNDTTCITCNIVESTME